MRNRALSVRRFLPLLAVALVMSVCSSAFAQATPPALQTVMETAATDVKTNLFIVVPIAFGILAVMLGVAFGWKKLKQAAKSS
jgi:hypothetical protein